jgi:hypothetical protein
VGVVFAVVVHVILILVLRRGYDNLNLTTEHQVETIAAGGLLKTWKARSIAPLVQFPTKCIGFDLDRAKFASSNQPMTAGSVDVGNRGVDYGRLGGATNLGQVRQKTSEIQEATIEGLTTLPLDCVVGRSSLGGVCPSARLSLSSRDRGVGISVYIMERLGDRRGRQWGGRMSRGSGSAVRRAGGDLKRHCHREKLR